MLNFHIVSPFFRRYLKLFNCIFNILSIASILRLSLQSFKIISILLILFWNNQSTSSCIFLNLQQTRANLYSNFFQSQTIPSIQSFILKQSLNLQVVSPKSPSKHKHIFIQISSNITLFLPYKLSFWNNQSPTCIFSISQQTRANLYSNSFQSQTIPTIQTCRPLLIPYSSLFFPLRPFSR